MAVFLRVTERVTAIKGLRKLGAALQACISLKGFFIGNDEINGIADRPSSSRIGSGYRNIIRYGVYQNTARCRGENYDG
jgi:hypothetical protein